jgi:hypothetical protein
VNRRKCLKSIGAAGFGALTLSGTALADEASLQKRVETLSGSEERRVLKSARKKDSYHELKQAIESHDDVAEDNSVSEANAVRVHPPDGSEMEFANFHLRTTRENARASIGVPLGDDTPASGTVVTASDDYTPASGTVATASDNFETTEETPDISVYKPSPAVTTAEQTEVGEVAQPTNSVSQASVDWPDISCSVCRAAVGVVNTVGCSLTGASACAIITAKTGVGPIACTGVYAASCFIIFTFGIQKPREVCETGGGGPCG